MQIQVFPKGDHAGGSQRSQHASTAFQILLLPSSPKPIELSSTTPLFPLLPHHCSLQDKFNQVGILLLYSQGHLSDNTIFFSSRTSFLINIQRTRPKWGTQEKKKAQKMCSGPWCSRARTFRLHRILNSSCSDNNTLTLISRCSAMHIPYTNMFSG